MALQGCTAGKAITAEEGEEGAGDLPIKCPLAADLVYVRRVRLVVVSIPQLRRLDIWRPGIQEGSIF